MINLYLQGESYPNAPDIFHFNFITKCPIKKYTNIIFITSTLISNQGEIIFKFIKIDTESQSHIFIIVKHLFLTLNSYIEYFYIHLFIISYLLKQYIQTLKLINSDKN